MGYQSCNHHVNQHFQIRYHLDWGSAFNVRQCRIAWFDTSAVTTDGTVPGMETEEKFLYAHFVLNKPGGFQVLCSLESFCWKMFRCLEKCWKQSSIERSRRWIPSIRRFTLAWNLRSWGLGHVCCKFYWKVANWNTFSSSSTFGDFFNF